MLARIASFFILLLLLPIGSIAQNSETILTLGLPGYIQGQVNESWFDEFEDRHNVRLVLADISEENFVSFADESHAQQLEKVEKLVSSADVVLLSDRMLSLQSTRANYFLNIEPLVLADNELNIEDFYPSLWNAYAWYDGRWGMPVSGSLVFWLYNSQAFDSLGLGYPDANWTIEEIALTARSLAQNENGGLSPILSQNFEAILLRSLLSTTEPSELTDNDILILETWTQLRREGIVGLVFDDAPQSLSLGVMQDLLFPRENREIALLSNEQAGLSSQALLISRGTNEAQLAYELTKYLIRNAEFVSLFAIPALRTLDSGMNAYSPEIQNILYLGIDNAIPYSQSLTMPLLLDAIDIAIDNELPISETILEAENNWEVSLLEAEERATRTLLVETPFLPQEGTTVVRFGFDRGPWLTVYNQEQWQNFAEDFSQENNIFIDFDSDMGYSSLAWSRDYDCIYTQRNLVSFDAESYLSLNPLLDADRNFAPNDFLGTSLEQVQFEGQIIGYPISLFPIMLAYDVSQLPIDLESGAWNVSELLDTVRALKSEYPDVAPLDLGGKIDMLIISFGGIPIDYRSNPPIVNLLAPETMNAIQQVLDLAREGLISYELMMPNMMSMSSAAIHTSEFAPYMLDPEFSVQIKPFPSGINLNAASYSIGAIYISAQSIYYNECYQFATALANQTELLTGMPARASLIDAMNNYAFLDEDVQAFYNDYRDLLQASNTVVIPRQAEGGEHFFEQMVLPYWLHRAYDRYVLENADLRFELEQAQTIIDSYFACVANAQAVDVCARSADPDFNLFGG